MDRERRSHDNRDEDEGTEWREARIYVMRTLEGHQEEIRELKDAVTGIKIKVAAVSLLCGAVASLGGEFVWKAIFH